MNNPRFSPASRQTRTRLRPETVEPGARTRLPRRRLTEAYTLAVGLPLATAALSIPFRQEHGRTVAIILVVPVVVVATLGATGPALIAALVAGIAYDVFLTAPYNTVAIDDPDEIAAMIALIAVGLIVGWLASRVARLGARATGRSTELRHLTEFSLFTTTTTEPAQLIDQASRHIAAVLNLASCTWRPGPHSESGPVLLPHGGLMGFVTELSPDRAQLPTGCVLPAYVQDNEIGRFVLDPIPGTVTSYEERRTATTIAQLLAAQLRRFLEPTSEREAVSSQ